MNRFMMRLATIATATALLFVVSAGAASAAKPVDGAERIKINETFQDPGFAGFLSFACGVPNLDVTVTERSDFWAGPEGASGHSTVKVVITNTDTGQYLVQSYANRFSTSSTETFADGDLLTIRFVDTNQGLAQKWHAPGLGVIVRDAGNVTIRGTVVIDTTIDPAVADPTVSFEVDIESKGKHPWAEQGFEPTPDQAAAICGAIGGTDLLIGA